VSLAWPYGLDHPVRGRPPKDDDIEERVGAEPVGPCTETQAASPMAINPGTMASGLPSRSVRTSPSRLVGTPPML
jgi:hypothetical protein